MKQLLSPSILQYMESNMQSLLISYKDIKIANYKGVAAFGAQYVIL